MQDAADSFCVLSLDGGGARGYLSIRYLENLERHLNKVTGNEQSLGKRFDFITGTSTGGIIALGLASGMSAADLRGIYESYLPRIFGPKSRRYIPWRRPKYKSELLQKFLKTFLENKTLGDLTVDVCIVGVSLQNAQPRLFKTDYLERNAGRLKESLVDIALCTSAAPYYFASHSSEFSSFILDGGLCANNPSMIALVESLQFERKSKRGRNRERTLDTGSTTRLRMLSVGTGISCAMPYDYTSLANTGARGWARTFSAPPFFEITMQSQSILIEKQTALLLKENYFRFNPTLTFSMKLDDTQQLKALTNLSDLTEADIAFAKRLI